MVRVFIFSDFILESHCGQNNHKMKHMFVVLFVVVTAGAGSNQVKSCVNGLVLELI